MIRSRSASILVSSSYWRLFEHGTTSASAILIGLPFTVVLALLCSFLRDAASMALFVVVCTFLSKASISLISRSFFDKISCCFKGLTLALAADCWF